MKYKINLILLGLTYYSFIQSSYQLEQHTSQMLMFTRPTFNSIGIHQASWYDFGYHNHKLGTGFQLYPIYSHSFPTNETAQYFLFDFKNELSIRGGTNPTGYTLTADGYVPNNPKEDQISTNSYNRDILGQWFNFNEVKSGFFTVNPKQKQACCVIEVSQDLKKLTGWSFADKFYAAFRMPITWMTNNLGLQADKIALEALTANTNYYYYNFSNCNQHSTAVTNLQILLGTKYLRDEDTHIITGTGIIIPFVEQNKNYLMFEPLNGFGTHLALTAIALFQFPLVVKNDIARSRICFFFEFENNFLARDHQLRTFDLIGKPYSRYMKLLDRATNTTVPATNALTIRSRVEPYNVFNMATGFRLKYKNATGEIGYELWARPSERITPEPKQAWDDSRYGIAFINEDGVLAKINGGGAIVPIDPATENGQTASQSTINYVAAPDGVVTLFPALAFTQKNQYISFLDLDNMSASARGAIVNRAYMTVGIGQKGQCRDFFANIGLYIESSQRDSALSMWGAWGKLGLAF